MDTIRKTIARIDAALTEDEGVGSPAARFARDHKALALCQEGASSRRDHALLLRLYRAGRAIRTAAEDVHRCQNEWTGAKEQVAGLVGCIRETKTLEDLAPSEIATLDHAVRTYEAFHAAVERFSSVVAPFVG